jgi:two-component system, cell cycle response regulator DivK
MRKTILIIDDDTRNIFALSAVLRAKYFHCLTATSAPEGIELLRSNKQITAVLIDIMMPDMDGYEAIKIIKNDVAIASVPVIAVTARAMQGDETKILHEGADAYISKPVDVDKLLKVLSEF